MIQIKRQDTRVLIEVDSKMPVKLPVYLFQWETNNENWAELLATRLQDQLRETIITIRRTAYEQGYKDGRGKHKREDWFYGGLQ